MAKNNFKRIRKVADVAEHNRKYGLKLAEEPNRFVLSDGNTGTTYLPPELPRSVPNPTLAQVFSFIK